MLTPNAGANDDLARGLAQAGTTIQERTDADLVMRAETKLKDDYLTWEADAKQRRGRQAWGVAKDASKWFDDNAGKIGGDLSNPRQQQLYAQTVAKLRTQALGTFSELEAGQRRASLDDSAQASIVGSINLAAANPQNAEALTAAKADVITRNRARAQLNGWAPEVTQAKEAEYLTNFHKQVIQSLARDYPDKAKEYFDANKAEIEGSQQAEVGAFAAKATATRLGESTADAAWQKLGPKGDRDPVQLDVLETEIRNALGTQDEARKAAIAAVRERAAAFKDSRKERDEKLEANVNTAVLKGAGIREVQAMPEFLRMDGEKQRKLVDFMEARSLRAAQRAAADESRAASREVRAQSQLTRDGMGAYMVYSDPNVLSKMSRDQVLNLLPDLGNELTSHLIQRFDTLQKPAKLAEAKMDRDDFNHVARAMNLPVDDKATPAQKEMMGELHFRVEQTLETEQTRTGKPLSRKDKMDLMRNEMARTVTVSGWFSNSQVPVIALSADQVKDVKIPGVDREQLAASMAKLYARTKSKDYEPTDDNLRRFYLMTQSSAASMILPPK